MAHRKGCQKHEALKVEVIPVSAPDAEQRLRVAYQTILRRAAARVEEDAYTKPVDDQKEVSDG